MKHTVVTIVLSVSLTLLLCSGLLNYYQYSQRSVFSCTDGYSPAVRNAMNTLIRESAGMNLPVGGEK